MTTPINRRSGLDDPMAAGRCHAFRAEGAPARPSVHAATAVPQEPVANPPLHSRRRHTATSPTMKSTSSPDAVCQ